MHCHELTSKFNHLYYSVLNLIIPIIYYTLSEEIVTPSNRTAEIWKHFGFKRDLSGKLNKSERALCKVCKQSVAHGGGTTNLRNHLRTAHSSLYIELLSSNSHGKSSLDNQEKLDRFSSSTSVDRLTSSSQRAKSLTDAVAQFIARDMRPVNVLVDGLGFLNLMHIAEPCYVVPCRKTMMGIICQKYSELKHIVHGEIAQQNCLSLTTDMWTSKTGAGYISLTSHFQTSDFQMMHRNLGT